MYSSKLKQTKMSDLVQKARELVKGLETEPLSMFALTCPDEILNVILDELETRMTESEFVKLCETL